MRLRHRARRSLRAFRVAGANRQLRLVQLARLASVTGRWAYTITLAVYAYRIGGAGGVALVGIVRLAPAAAARFIGTVTGNSTSADAADAVVGSRLGLRSGFTAV